VEKNKDRDSDSIQVHEESVSNGLTKFCGLHSLKIDQNKTNSSLSACSYVIYNVFSYLTKNS